MLVEYSEVPILINFGLGNLKSPPKQKILEIPGKKNDLTGKLAGTNSGPKQSLSGYKRLLYV
jgi:hypothetical protein